MAMTIYPKAECARNDTIQYMLANLNCCMLHVEERAMLIEYSRGNAGIDDRINYSQLEQVVPGLSKLIIGLNNQFGNSTLFSRTASATCAYVVGAHIDLSCDDLLAANYSFFSNISRVGTTSQPDLFSFKGLHFKIDTDSQTGLPYANVSNEDEVLLSVQTMEKLWPNSSKYVPFMEALCYPDYEIVQSLFNGVGQCDVTISLEDVQLDV